MLRIDIPSSAIAANVFTQETLPTPPNGTETEINGDLILLFEDEAEAVAYLDELEDYAAELDGGSPEKTSVNALVSAITNDEFVQAYLQ
ncbi:hypothetical protein [Mucilaginibacter phyllosphaerae]|uniref:Uncharacterized protein n=1 Tax=Mucilaginibacter phyllosphaerae TaxID=1812349 RepID=A0A4Y8A8U3_9SPHI|nr:hypothetical protein [Mucilaginibacter phyllosphaerae]MBB3970862.1 hypothetical protein [Mucilaginibacter phyllosphaerae]TEW64203.1 hypothetical protein E2R65_17800 [Mucilaginibacter phyllosphaerae]GGH05062.1 hypothetical protein GCM10007352_08640 [Mucilaginibacter phyllosphaerae]